MRGHAALSPRAAARGCACVLPASPRAAARGCACVLPASSRGATYLRSTTHREYYMQCTACSITCTYGVPHTESTACTRPACSITRCCYVLVVCTPCHCVVQLYVSYYVLWMHTLLLAYTTPSCVEDTYAYAVCCCCCGIHTTCIAAATYTVCCYLRTTCCGIHTLLLLRCCCAVALHVYTW